MKKNNKKRTLILSLISILVCLTMLIGSTFAWFTDTASTAVNKIESGTLDIDLLHRNGEEWETAENKTLNFVQNHCTNGRMLWEPGCTYDLEPVKVVNKGNLALKYKIELTGIDGNAELLEVIDWTVKMGDTEIDLAEFEGVLYPNPTTAPGITIPADGSYESGNIVISGHMREEAGNEYQGKSVEGIGITVYATQYTWECDSNNNQYDAGAEYATPVATTEELAAAVARGENVVLTENITLPEVLVINGDVTIYGKGDKQLIAGNSMDRVINAQDNTEPVALTLSGVDIVGPTTDNNGNGRGVSFYNNTGGVTLVIDNCSLSASCYALNISSQNQNVNVIVKNTTITGWCAAQTHSAGTKMTFENCTLIGNNDKTYNADGWNNFSTIVVNATAPNTEMTFTNCRIEANQTTGNVQTLLSIRASGAKITFNGCSFFVGGIEIAIDDLGTHFALNTDVTDPVVTVDGTVIPAASMFSEEP